MIVLLISGHHFYHHSCKSRENRGQLYISIDMYSSVNIYSLGHHLNVMGIVKCIISHDKKLKGSPTIVICYKHCSFGRSS